MKIVSPWATSITLKTGQFNEHMDKAIIPSVVLEHKMCIFAIALLSPLEKRHDPAHLNKLETHSSKGMFEIVVVLHKKIFFSIFFSVFLLFRYHLSLKTRNDPLF